MRQRSGEIPHGLQLLDFDDDEVHRAVRLYGKYVRERLRAFELSFIRVIGLVSALKRFCDRSLDDAVKPW